MAVFVEAAGPVAEIVMDRPKANAFDVEQVAALTAAFDDVRRRDDVRAVVLRARGEVAFSAGADLSSSGPLSSPGGLAGWTANAHRMLDAIADFRVPVVAALRRPAVGGGFEVALACHFRVLGAGAHVALPEIHRGYLPSWAAVERLAPLVGASVALDLLVTGRRVEPDEALRLGLVQRVSDDAEGAARELALSLAQLPPLAVAAALDQVRGIASGDARGVVRAREIADLERLVATGDTMEGILAFFQKRTPTFKGT